MEFGTHDDTKRKRRTHFPAFLALLLAATQWAGAELIDLSQTVVVTDGDARIPAEAFVGEIARKTGLTWEIVSAAPSDGPSVQITVDNSAGLPAEGYRVVSEGSTVTITGADKRGALFGAGFFLRKMVWSQGSVSFAEGTTESAPQYSIRGHQLGYRPTANSWDAWSPEEFERYILELAFLGLNAVENIPYQLTDTNPLMQHSRMDINIHMSRVCEKYDLDYWIWLPAPDDITVEEDRLQKMRENGELFRQTPRVDGVFVPGGDPGDNHPSVLLPFLQELNDSLKKYHPNAGVWTSLQKFDEEKTDCFLNYLQEHQPTWLEGIVDGPWAPPINSIRHRIPSQYSIRSYPDITHNVRCQFHVPWWDPVFAYTLGREACNPRPEHFAGIFREIIPPTDGFVTYSDGVHDDVNKVLWNLLGWSQEADIREILVDYCNFFFGSAVASDAADGILALEQNWYGPVIHNGGIETAFNHWKALEAAHPELRTNWRWQLCLLRAYYDSYMRNRRIHEYGLEQEAYDVLVNAQEQGADAAMTAALEVLNRVTSEEICTDRKARIVELCEELNQSISLQTSVERYGARNPERGAVLDFIDLPLNNRWWLEDEFTRIRGFSSEDEKLARLEVIRTWENPGPGSYYDDIGDVSQCPHVLRGESIVTDPAFDRTAVPFFLKWDDGFTRKRNSWPTNVHWPEGMVYDNLDTEATYVIRVTGTGRLVMRVNGEILTSDNEDGGVGEFRHYAVPQNLTQTGRLELTWDDVDAGSVRWRQYSRIAEVWLLKQ